MLNPVRRKVMRLALVALAAAMPQSVASAQGAKPAPQVITDKAQRGDSAGAPAAAPDLAKLNAMPDRAAPFVRAAKKGGTAKGSQVYYLFTFDNWTDYYLDCYYQGSYAGTLRPWGELDLEVTTGNATVSCRAPGSGLRWGPRRLSVRGDYTWRLDP